MKLIYYFKCCALILLMLPFTNCKDQAQPVASTDEEPIANERPAKLVYDPSRGMHSVGEDMTKMLGDTLGITMYEFTMKPGDSVVWHEHPFHTIYVLNGGTLGVYFEDMEQQVMALPTGTSIISGPSGDSAVNIGDTTVRLLAHDIYTLTPEY